MRILVLTKRQYTGKDLLDDRFGRLRELPLELAKVGHEVAGSMPERYVVLRFEN